ncbi:MAG: hypothetical protein ABIR11_05540 [Candidatus Limnocylindrales bacterium]
MQRDPVGPELRSLIDAPSPATLTLFRDDGQVMTIVPDAAAEGRLAIATRYLGAERASAYAGVARRPPGFVIRLDASGAKAWDLSDSLP